MSSTLCTQPALKIHRLSFLLEKMADQALQHELDLSFSQCMILNSLSNNPKCSQQSIAKCRDLTQAAVSRQMETLQEKKLITREDNALNRREHVLKITQKGEAILKKGMAIMSEKFESALSVLTPEEMKQLQAQCEKVLDAIYKERDCGC
jgi:DNA-binding MarR family transcriptional regulator